MREHRTVIWVLISVVWFWSGLVAAPLSAQETRLAQQPAAPEGEEDAFVDRGVVVESVGKGSALEKAGLQPGDVLYRWRRLPNPPANPDEASGELESPFDWLELQTQEAPRGLIGLLGEREGTARNWTVQRGDWTSETRPRWSKELLARYLQGKHLIDLGEISQANEVWKGLNPSHRGPDRGDLTLWNSLNLVILSARSAAWNTSLPPIEALFRNRSDMRKAMVLRTIGNIALERGNLSLAKEYLLRSTQILEISAPRSLSLTASLNGLGLVAARQGDREGGLRYLRRVLAMQDEIAPESPNVANTLNNLCAFSQEIGDLSSAIEYGKRALGIETQLAPASLNMARIYNNLGNTYAASGDLQPAVQYYQKGLVILRARGDRGTDIFLNNLGIISRLRGDLDLADRYYRHALEIIQAETPDPIKISRALNNMGVVARHRGDLALAEEYYRRSYAIRNTEKNRDDLAIAKVLTNLGIIAHLRGNLDAATVYHMQALTLRESQGLDAMEIANSLNNLGNLSIQQGKLAAASDYLRRSLAIREKKAPDSLELAVTLSLLADLMRANNNPMQAAELYRRALGIRDRLAPATSFEEYLELARLYHTQGDLSAAVEYFERSLSVIESQLTRFGSSHEAETIFRTREQYPIFREALSLQVEQNHPEAAFHLLERSRAQGYLAMLAERELVFSDLPPELDSERRRLAVQYDRTLQSLQDLSPAKDEERIKTIHGDLLMLRQRQQELQHDIRERFPKLAAIQYPQPLDIATVRQDLDPGTVLLAYSVGEKETFLFVSAAGGLSIKKLAVREMELRQRVTEFRHLLGSAIGSSSLGTLRAPQLRELARELYAVLVQPAEGDLATAQRLLLLADGPLHLLPFAALQRPDGQFLGTWKPLHTALSATVWAELKATRRPAAGSSPAFALAAFGDPQYPRFQPTDTKTATHSIKTARNVPGDFRVRAAVETGLFDWSPLPGTRREVDQIARLFPESSVRTYLGKDATEEAAKALGREPRILHFAVHGHLDDRFPWNSALALTIPENPPEGRDNGLLQVWEILEGVRFDADLVVLSACETGLGEEQGGEGLIGLTRAFQYAGARSVLASLWSVNDQATAELMIRFYKHLRAGLPKDQALQAAQQELIRGPIEVTNEKGQHKLRDFSSPYYWAGFQLYGDWQ